jgi:hypothetical protein
MRLPLRTIGVIAVCFTVGICFAQTQPEMSSLCNLQEKVAQGEHIKVRVSGIYSVGPESFSLDDSCPVAPYRNTWVELELQSTRNKKELSKLVDRSGRAYVVFEGEFYGPPLPDPKLPEALRKAYHPNWGHLNCCSTKLVVSAIREVKVAPPAQP